MTKINRKTKVISISLPQETSNKLEVDSRNKGQSRSAYISFLIDKEVEKWRWERVYKKGRETARRMKITSENDIDRILHAS